MNLSNINRSKLDEMRQRLGHKPGGPWSWMNEAVARCAAHATKQGDIWILPDVGEIIKVKALTLLEFITN